MGTKKKSKLHLTVKKKWFDMILSGEKKEEYREIKPYWEHRFNPPYVSCDSYAKKLPKSSIYDIFYIITKIGDTPYTEVEIRNGYGKNVPTIIMKCEGISTGEPKPEWSDNWEGCVFIIKLGDIIETSNIKEY